MKNLTKTQWFVMALVVATILIRSFVHIDNFTPMLGASVVMGMLVSGPIAYIAPVVSMVASDIVLFFKQDPKYAMDFWSWMSFQPVVYALMGLSVWLGMVSRKSRFPLLPVGLTTGLASSGVFFVLSNLMVWLDPWGWKMYPMTLAGLQQCFVMAIPFFTPTLVSTLLYVPLFILLYHGVHKLELYHAEHEKKVWVL